MPRLGIFSGTADLDFFGSYLTSETKAPERHFTLFVIDEDELIA